MILADMFHGGLFLLLLIVAVFLIVAICSEDPRDAWARSEAEDDLRWAKAQRERERRDFERKILGE